MVGSRCGYLFKLCYRRKPFRSFARFALGRDFICVGHCEGLAGDRRVYGNAHCTGFLAKHNFSLVVRSERITFMHLCVNNLTSPFDQIDYVVAMEILIC